MEMIFNLCPQVFSVTDTISLNYVGDRYEVRDKKTGHPSQGKFFANSLF
jgi:hypothetical protein